MNRITQKEAKEYLVDLAIDNKTSLPTQKEIEDYQEYMNRGD